MIWHAQPDGRLEVDVERFDLRTAEGMHKWTAMVREMMAKSWRENCADTNVPWPLAAYIIMTEFPEGPGRQAVDPCGEVLSMPLLHARDLSDAHEAVRMVALRTKAVGVCLMTEAYRNDNPDIIPSGRYAGKPGTTECLTLYVEHKRFAPQLWFAEIKSNRELGPWEPSDEGSVRGIRYLPDGYMS